MLGGLLYSARGGQGKTTTDRRKKKRRLSALIMAKKAIFGLDLFIYDKSSTRTVSPQVGGSLPHELFTGC